LALNFDTISNRKLGEKCRSDTEFFDPYAMYCSAFVRYCYKEAGRDLLGPEISVSNTTSEDIAQAGIKAGKIEIFKP
jgi:hypothetical protein